MTLLSPRDWRAKVCTCVSRGLTEGISSGVKYTCRDRWVSVKLGGTVWQYLSHAALCLWLCQSENKTLSDSGRVCQRAYIHTHMCVQMYIRVLLSHTLWTPAKLKIQFFCSCIWITWVKTEFCVQLFSHTFCSSESLQLICAFCEFVYLYFSSLLLTVFNASCRNKQLHVYNVYVL